MNINHPITAYAYARMRQAELLQEADKARLLRQVRRDKSSYQKRALNRLAELMILWGTHLQKRLELEGQRQYRVDATEQAVFQE